MKGEYSVKSMSCSLPKNGDGVYMTTARYDNQTNSLNMHNEFNTVKINYILKI